jgi:hypothetical protein
MFVLFIIQNLLGDEYFLRIFLVLAHLCQGLAPHFEPREEET